MAVGALQFPAAEAVVGKLRGRERAGSVEVCD